MVDSEKTNIHNGIKEALVGAILDGDLKQVIYITTTENLKEEALNYIEEESLLTTACINGHLDIVKYLLTSPLLSRHPDINANDDSPLYYACSYGHLPVVEYLLTSPDLEVHSDVHISGDHIFRDVCTNNEYDILKFLIFDYGIKKTDAIQKFIEKDQAELTRMSKEMFAKRDFAENLGKSLSASTVNNRKPKV